MKIEVELSLKAKDIFDSESELFRIARLPILTEYELNEHMISEPLFFEHNDFIVMTNNTLHHLYEKHANPENENSTTLMQYINNFSQSARRFALQDRVLVGVKLGYLYIEYERGGKSSFSAYIYILDFSNHKARKVFHIREERYTGIEFADLLPFDSLYSPTFLGKRKIDDTIVTKMKAVRDFFKTLALGGKIETEKFREAYSNFLTRIFQDKDRERSISSVELIVVAEKIAEIYYTRLGVEKHELIGILIQYVKSSGKEMDEYTFIKLLNTYIDRERYQLKALLPDFFETKDRVDLLKQVNTLQTSEVKQTNSVLALFENSMNNLQQQCTMKP